MFSVDKAPVVYASDEDAEGFVVFNIDIEEPKNPTHFRQLCFDRIRELGRSGKKSDEKIFSAIYRHFDKAGRPDLFDRFLMDVQRLDDGKACRFAVADPYEGVIRYYSIEFGTLVDLYAKGREFFVFKLPDPPKDLEFLKVSLPLSLVIADRGNVRNGYIPYDPENSEMLLDTRRKRFLHPSSQI